MTTLYSSYTWNPLRALFDGENPAEALYNDYMRVAGYVSLHSGLWVYKDFDPTVSNETTSCMAVLKFHPTCSEWADYTACSVQHQIPGSELKVRTIRPRINITVNEIAFYRREDKGPYHPRPRYVLVGRKILKEQKFFDQ
jgi:hypothetical protein